MTGVQTCALPICSRVAFKQLSDAELDGYLATRTWQGCSGAYAIQEHDDPFVRVVVGSVSNVVGLPLESLARWLYERYASIVAEWCQQAAHHAGETCAVPFGRLARVLVASVDGLILQHVCDPNDARSREDLDATIEMLIALAGVRPGAQVRAG